MFSGFRCSAQGHLRFQDRKTGTDRCRVPLPAICQSFATSDHAFLKKAYHTAPINPMIRIGFIPARLNPLPGVCEPGFVVCGMFNRRRPFSPSGGYRYSPCTFHPSAISFSTVIPSVLPAPKNVIHTFFDSGSSQLIE